MALIQGIVDTQKQNLKSLGIVNSGDDLTIELEVKQNGVNIEFVNPIFELLATKSDGTRVRQLVDITYIGNVVNIIGDEQLVTSPGIVTLQLIIKDNKRSSTCLFYFMCGTSLDRDIIQSISKVEVLNQLDEYVVQAFANLKEYEQRIIASDASIRNLNEDMIKAESVRESAENTRKESEANRVNKENERALAETERKSNEEARKNEEVKRVESEKVREKQESNRQSNYLTKENERDNSYTAAEKERNRVFNFEEAKRVSQEDVRKNSEVQRQNSENSRVEAENNRASKETKRVEAESSRSLAETNRANAETKRVEAENIRKQKEDERISEEAKRVESFNTMKAENEEFKKAVNDKTGDIEKGFFEDKQYENAKVRLDHDFEHVNRRLNQAELLKYEGAVVVAEKTYQGLTSEMLVKGRTYQNLFKTKPVNTTISASVHSGYMQTTYDLSNKVFSFIFTVRRFDSEGAYYFIRGQGKNTPFGEYQRVYVKSPGRYALKVDLTDKDCFQILCGFSGEGSGTIEDVLLLEGDYTNVDIGDIPYCEGIYSVGEQEKIGDKYKVGIKSYGKNLLDIEKFKNVENHNNVPKTELATFNKCFLIKNTKPNTKYTICRTSSAVGTVNVSILNSDGSRASLTSGTSTNRTIETSSDGLLYIAIQSVTQERITTALSESGELWLEEGAIPTPYEPYQSDTKYLLVDEPLRSLLNGVSDTIDELGVETKRVGKIILDGSENWGFSVEQENTIRFYISNRTGKTSFGYCDTLTYRASGMPHGDYEYILINPTNIFINIAKSKLTTQDVEGVKNWLQTNNTTLIYELAEPIVINHNKNLNLKTYEGTTYISSENTLKANISCKVPSNVQAVLQDTRARNRELENELETTTLKLKEADNILKEMDTDLIKTNWEMDDRLFEVEWALEDAGLVTSVSTFNINNKMRGSASVMALSKFEQAKIIIMSGDYDRVTLEGQLSKYLKRNIIAQEEYDTLISMMDAKEIVVGE